MLVNAAHRRDLITGAVITAIGVVYYVATFSIELTDDVITPGTFPAIVGIGLIVLGLVLCVQSVIAGRKTIPVESSVGNGATASARDSVSESKPEGIVIEAPEEPPTKKVALQFAIFFLYLGLLIPVGFLLSTAAFLMALTTLYARDRWIRNLVFSVLFSAIVYFAFVYGLSVYLPVGILG